MLVDETKRMLVFTIKTFDFTELNYQLNFGNRKTVYKKLNIKKIVKEMNFRSFKVSYI